MIKDTLKSYKSDNRGSAIITGLVVSAVLMVLCLSLLLVAYSLFISTSKSTSDFPDREMLYSAAEALEHELLDFTAQYDNDTLISDLTGRDFWKYINDNIWQGFDSTTGAQSTTGGYWLYFDRLATSGDHADLEKCSKYLNISSIGSVKIVVQLYWELPKGFNEDKTNKDKTILNAIYRLYNNKGEVLVKTERKYILSKKLSGSTGTQGGTDTHVPLSSTGSFIELPFVSDTNTGLTVKFVCYSNYGSGCTCEISIVNNTNAVIQDWSIIIKTNNTIVSYGRCNYRLIASNDGVNTYEVTPKEHQYLQVGNNNGLFSYNGTEDCLWIPELIRLNNIDNNLYLNSSTLIKWNRIGEDIINPGGGN